MNAQKLQSSVEGARQFHLLMNDRDHQIGGHLDPYLRLHRVWTCAVKVLDPQMLLDPSEEQLDSPTHLVEHGNCQGRDLKVVGEKDQFPFGFRVVVADFSQKCRKGVSRFGETRFADMVASQTGEAIHRQRVVPGELQYAFSSRDEEGARVCNEEEAGEIHVAAIHQIECARFKQQAVKPAHVMLTCSGDVDAGWNRTPQVDLGVHLDARHGLPEGGPWEEGQREVDGRRVEGIDGVVEVQSEFLADIQGAGLAHEALGKVFPEPPIALFVGIRESGFGNRLTEPEMMQIRRSSIEAGGDVTESFPPSQLGEDHANELLAAAKMADTRLGLVTFDHAGKRLAIYEVGDLREDVASRVYRATRCLKSKKSSKAWHQISFTSLSLLKTHESSLLS